MAGLGTILGGFGAAEQGAEAGIRQSKADQMQDRSDELRTQQLAAETALVPQRAALAKQQLTGAQNDLTDKETLRPMAQQASTDAYNLAHVESVAKVAQAAMTGAITTVQARDQLLGHLGMTAATGDSDGTAAMINELAKTPAFPRMKEFGNAVAAQTVNVPSGTQDIGGNPISGPALAVKFDSGQTQYINPASWQRQVTQMQASLDKAAQVKLRPGETIYNSRTGKATFTAPPPPGMEYVGENPDGSPIYRKVAPGGAGTGAGKGSGKPTKDETIAAVDGMLKDVAEKITVEQKGQAYTLAQRAVDSGAVTDPVQAAQLGIDAALHPEKVKPQFNPETGVVDRIYQDPSFAQGRRITVAPNAVKLEDFAKTVEPVVMKNLAEAQLTRESSVAPEDQRGALRDQWIKVANDPALRAQFLEAAAAKGGAQGRAVAQGKLDLIQKYGPRPAGAPAAPPSASDRLRSGGLLNNGYTPPPGSPAARAAEQRAQAAKRFDDRDVAKQESARILSSQFQRDLAAMEPLALVRKYDSMRSQLSPADAQALQDATRKL